MSQTGSVWAGLLGLQKGRFDVLEVYSSDQGMYVNVAAELGALVLAVDDLENRPSTNDARLDAIEAKLAALDEQKATKFVALDPLSLNESTFPNQLSQSGPTPQSASAINLNGDTAYIQFDGRTHVLDLTKDWAVGCSIQTQGEGVEGTNMTAFFSGGTALCLKVQGPPEGEGRNWGGYNSSNGPDLYHVSGRFNANTWSSPSDDSRLLWVYTAADKKLCYYISYADGSYSRKADITVPQSAIDEQILGNELAFGKAWTGPGGAAFSGTGYQAIVTHWVLSPHAWTEEELVEYFDSPIEDLPSLSLYDKVSSFITPGVYPNLVDAKGTLTNGQLIGGEEADFLV